MLFLRLASTVGHDTKILVVPLWIFPVSCTSFIPLFFLFSLVFSYYFLFPFFPHSRGLLYFGSSRFPLTFPFSLNLIYFFFTKQIQSLLSSRVFIQWFCSLLIYYFILSKLLSFRSACLSSVTVDRSHSITSQFAFFSFPFS